MADARSRLEIPCASMSPGMAFGKAYSYRDISLGALEQKQFPVGNLTEENDRLAIAIEKSKAQLANIQHVRPQKSGDPIDGIFEVQLAILQDEYFLAEIRQELSDRMINLEYIIATKIRDISKKFQTMKDETIRSKFSDIQDAYQRILRNLLEIDHVHTHLLQRITSPVILIAERLLPSDIALLDITKLLGTVLEEISETSHTAIMLRALGIPAVGNVKGLASLINTGNPVLVDAINGKVIIMPNEEDISTWNTWKDKTQPIVDMKNKSQCLKTTRDGVRIHLEANVGSIIEVEEAANQQADGIGLLRSEIFYMSKTVMPSAAEETAFLQAILQRMPDRPVTLRLLDLGADKRLPYLPMKAEDNPQLGTRGLRYLFENKTLIQQQISAIVSAGAPDQFKILLPFVTVVDDVLRTLEIINEHCHRIGADIHHMKIGVMVEVPSAALAIESIIDHVEFVSIGTNDLVQYLFAASREEAGLERYRQVSHPLVLRMIRAVVDCAQAKQKQVTLCGDAASDPMMAPLLVGMGIRTLSMAAPQIPVIRSVLSNCPFSEMQKAAEKAQRCSTVSDVSDLMMNLYQSTGTCKDNGSNH
jgi:phosphoenolpyruvate-protein phosphotransferase